VGANPTQFMYVCVCVSYVFVFCIQVEALRRADPPVQRVLPAADRIKKLKIGLGSTKGCRSKTIIIIIVIERCVIIFSHCHRFIPESEKRQVILHYHPRLHQYYPLITIVVFAFRRILIIINSFSI
jgi:hypothetical protein